MKKKFNINSRYLIVNLVLVAALIVLVYISTVLRSNKQISTPPEQTTLSEHTTAQEETKELEKLNIYKGEIHSHTAASDGNGTVEEAYAFARDVGKADFFALTDHDTQLTEEEFLHACEVADSHNEDGRYVAFYGYEGTYTYKTGYYGHINIINNDRLFKANDYSLQEYYQLMAGFDDVIVQLNHPNIHYGNFDEFAHLSPEADNAVCLMEIRGHTYEFQYMLALAKGWHISPAYSGDDHKKNWTLSLSSTAVLAPNLTRNDILAAFAANRVYASNDDTLDIYYSINNEWMGARLDSPEKLDVRVEVSTEKDYGLGTITLITEDNIVVAFENIGAEKSYTWELSIPAEYDYYYVKVQSEGVWGITSPIWIENNNYFSIGEASQKFDKTAGGYYTGFPVTNTSDSDLKNVRVSFYISPLDSKIDVSAEPKYVVEIGTLAKGETVIAEHIFKFEDITSWTNDRRVSVIVEAAANEGRTVKETSYTVISPVYITELLVNNESLDTEPSPYEFVELYNNTNQDFILNDEYTLCYYFKNGAPGETHVSLENIVLPARSAAVIWLKPSGSNLTVDDFNKFFGTSLVEGKNIFVLKRPLLLLKNYSFPIMIYHKRTDLARVWYNLGNSKKEKKSQPLSAIYAYPTGYTSTMKIIDNYAVPTPGECDPMQIPGELN